MYVVGIMSGTSADGADAVLMRISGAPPDLNWRMIAHAHQPYPEEVRKEIFAAFRPETSQVDRICRLNFALGRVYAQAALKVIAEAGMTPPQVDLIGSHGQTLWHIPADEPGASTLQVGEPAVIAELTGITVVSNFRTRDMAAGGQGAPLVAYVDTLLLSDPVKTRAAQNIGGIANVTYLPPHSGGAGEPFAFDTGPGNMLIDDAAGRATQGTLAYDRDGRLASAGVVHAGLLEELLREPYLGKKPPKTTGRELFGAQRGREIWEKAAALQLSAEDVLATLTAFTAESIARAYRDFLPAQPEEVIVSGGGARNPMLMQMLRDKLAPVRVFPSGEVGLAVDAKEAVAFAILAYETWHGRPGNLPSATGASQPVILGSVTPVPVRFTAGAGAGILTTEEQNPRARDLDSLDAVEIVELMNQEDRQAALAVSQAAPAIGQAVKAIAGRMEAGGRLIYLGAGTSGRLGVLDASECPPTFGVEPGLVVGIIAGGERALRESVEGAEDQPEQGAEDLRQIQLGPGDCLVGIAASGSTPYVLGGLRYARQVGALTVAVACNRPAAIAQEAEISILVPVGPEVINGSTRLKAGTAQKMVLNMLSTGVMVLLGKTYGDLMVDVQAGNAKLKRRAVRLVQRISGVDEMSARQLLDACGWEVKTAAVCQAFHCDPAEARQRLADKNGRLRDALGK